MIQYNEILNPRIPQPYLEHFGKGHDDSPPGRGSGRYAWGSGKKGRLRKQRKNEAGKNSEAESKPETQEEYEARKQKALQSGTAADILRFRGDLTNEQMNRAIQRLDLEKRLVSYSMEGVKTNKEKMEELMKDVKTVTGWANTGADAYNVFVRYYNSTERGEKSPLKPIYKIKDTKPKKDPVAELRKQAIKNEKKKR